LKSPVRANRTPGSVRGAPGNRCPYLDISFCLIPSFRGGFARPFDVGSWMLDVRDGGMLVEPGAPAIHVLLMFS
jgi:hypothetical protein